MPNDNSPDAYQTPDAAMGWEEVASGEWWLRIGNPEGLMPLALIGTDPDRAALGRMESSLPPFRWSNIRNAVGTSRCWFCRLTEKKKMDWMWSYAFVNWTR
jgi:hypothetical protein